MLIACGIPVTAPWTLLPIHICHIILRLAPLPSPPAADQADVLQHTVPALGSLIGHPALLAQLQEASTAVASEPGRGDAAMLQLEALHTLLLILPLPQVRKRLNPDPPAPR